MRKRDGFSGSSGPAPEPEGPGDPAPPNIANTRPTTDR